MKAKKKYSLLVAAFILSVLTGFVFEHLYNNNLQPPFSPQKFTESLHREIHKAERITAQIAELENLKEDAFIRKLFSVNDDIAFFIFQDESLLFWNTNQFQTENMDFEKDGQWHFVQLLNVYGIYKWVDQPDEVGILSFIPVKWNFPYENDFLKNDFHNRFDINKQIVLSDEDEDENGITSISDPSGRYLFTLKADAIKFNGFYSKIGFISFALAFLLLLILFYNINIVFQSDKLKKTHFFMACLSVGALIFITSYIDYPGLFFSNQLFSPHHYAANQLFNTFTHLSVICFFIVTAILLYRLKVRETNTPLWLNKIAFLIYVWFFFETLKSLILHSNINLNIAVLTDVHFINIWAQLIIFSLIAGMFFLMQIMHGNERKFVLSGKNLAIYVSLMVVCFVVYVLTTQKFSLLFLLLLGSLLLFDLIRIYYFKNKFNFAVFGVLLFLLSLITFFVSYQLNEHKKDIKYKIQAENILVNGNAENDPIAELLLEELDKNLFKDGIFKQLSQHPDSINAINKHVYNHHLSSFWNKYDVIIYPITKNTSETAYFVRFLESTGQRIKQTCFYSLPASLYDMSFIGLFDADSTSGNADLFNEILVFEFHPKRNFRSYSFPDLLISKESNTLRQAHVSISKYEDSNLIYSDLKFEWHENDSIFKELEQGFEKVSLNDQVFYVFTKDNTRIAITEITPFSFRNLFFYALFVFLLCLLIAKFVFWLFEIKQQKRSYALGLTSKFQLVFISLLFASFVGILIFSVNYIRNNYRQEQISNLENKKKYLQKSLQDLYYWIEDVAAIDELSLNNNLQELAYRYQTDINIYDIAGKLMGSSQSLVFSKNLISTRMSPEVYFSNHNTENQYERIGELQYLSAHTDLINGDYLQIGFISIPQYFSQTEINAKIEQFLGAIIQIYLIIIIFSIILILITGRQLAEPLRQLESKMKSMHLGGKNEKVEYRSKDEIGQLVKQYNRTVDELEKSTQLLLASERETAWRTMARQVAHEINNPLTPMKLTIQQLQRTKKMKQDEFDAYFEKAAETLIEQIDNLSRIAGTFSQFARMPETRFSDVDIAKKLFSVVGLFRHNHENIQIGYAGPESGIIVSGDSEQLIQVFNNVLKNATQSIKKGVKGKIEVELQEAIDDVVIKVTDNGTGIPETNRDNIFKPSFTTKNTGMGLGLSISKSIIENMGGKITFNSSLNEGTTFEISINKKDNH
jgi:two-component system, NtrC family, nitrogen regulation sensor histidine kinase NtrY